MKKKSLDQKLKEDILNPETPPRKIWPEFEVKPAESETKLPTMESNFRHKWEGKYYIVPISLALVGFNEQTSPNTYDRAQVEFQMQILTRYKHVPDNAIFDPNQEA